MYHDTQWKEFSLNKFTWNDSLWLQDKPLMDSRGYFWWWEKLRRRRRRRGHNYRLLSLGTLDRTWTEDLRPELPEEIFLLFWHLSPIFLPLTSFKLGFLNQLAGMGPFTSPFHNLLCMLLGISFTVWFTLLLVFIILPAIFGLSFGIRRLYMNSLLKVFEVSAEIFQEAGWIKDKAIEGETYCCVTYC